MRWVVLALIFLISCAPAVKEVAVTPSTQEVVAKPVVEAKPKPVVTQPPLETAQILPAEPLKEETESPKLSPLEECVNLCNENCERAAQNACTQRERSQCKANCGSIIDPSACSQACTYITQPNVCKQQLEEFCSNQCVEQCH